MGMETEVVLLKAIYDHINEMVNYALLEVRGLEPNQMVMFHDATHRTLFYILLVDFLSATDSKGPLPKTIFLQGLEDICNKPNFSKNNSEDNLVAKVKEFRSWLQEIKEIDIWMPSIDHQVTLKITRVDMIKMSGDISKHNYLRAIGVANTLQGILEKSGVKVNESEALLALSDFSARFNEDVLIYLSSHICEFLNDIRLGIYEYLLPEFYRSYVVSDDDSFPIYRYTIPDAIQTEYAKTCYWDLMNHIRSKPYLPRFIVSECFKTEY